MSNQMQLLLVASVKSVATVMLCAGVGAYGHRRGLLPDTVQRALEKLLQEIFLPALVLYNVTPCMNPQQLRNVWPLGVVCVFVVVAGLVAGYLMSRCLGVVYPEAFPKYRGLVMVACAFPNSFTVPVTLVLALGDQPVFLTGGQEGGAALVAHVNMLFLLSYGLWILARWSIGFPIMLGVPSFKQWRQQALNPPVRACFLGAVAGLVWSTALPADWQPGGARAADFAVFAMPLAYAGRCTVPLVLLTLGAKLDEALADVCATGAAKGAPLLGEEAAEVQMPLAGHLSVILFRQVCGPLLGAAVALGFLRRLCGVEDNLVLFVGMLQFAGPPMINLGIMAGLSGNALKETSVLLLISYIVSVVSWVVSIAFFLHILSTD